MINYILMPTFNKLDGEMPANATLRWVILPMCILIVTGSYYCYDIPAALEEQIQDVIYYVEL